MNKLFLSSLITVSLMFSFVFAIVMAVLVYAETVDVGFAIISTIIINLVLWLIGPWITDWINKFFYHVQFISKDELAANHPEVHGLIEQVCAEHKFRFPKIGIIPDQNPTAFTYGSGRYNARIVITQGLFTYLTPEEVQAVVAHELGHVVHRDFIIMMVASTLVQILYEIYASLIKSKGKRSGSLKLIALASYVLYLISMYLLYFLSRTREYLADAFAATKVSPAVMANALIKVAYGIVASSDETSSKRLLESTRHLGIIDVKNAKHLGLVSYITHADPNVVAEVMVYDRVNPWAKITELSSTHPLTGNRIDYLADMARAVNQPFAFDVDAAQSRMNIDHGRLYSHFWQDLFVSCSPYLLGVSTLLFLPLAFVPAAIGIGLLIVLLYRFPQGQSTPLTVLEAMRNPYASPIRGQAVTLEGRVIGKGIPGYVFSEDMMYQDNSGLIFLNYISAWGFIGDLIFSLKRVKELMGQPSRVAGWFYRSMSASMTLASISTQDKIIKSHPILGQSILIGFLFITTVFLMMLS